ncbi:MAG: ABC transporter permease, partial [Chloroflexi bacterium]|nr:ABC transporter permease [Chloroflexota bacterium]
SKIIWITAVGFFLVVLISGFFMFILKDPEQAHRLGLIGAKAQIFGGSADWPSFFNLVLLIMSVGGLIIFGLIFVWVFGREFGDRTIYDLLSLPMSRVTIVMAKLITAAYWSMALILLVFILMLGIGAILQLPGWSVATVVNGLESMMVTGILTVLLCIPFALVACVTRGYLPAVGCIFLVLILVQVISQLGYGQYFPWTIPLFYSGAAEALTGKAAIPLGFISYLLVGLVSVLSLIITCAWWQYADQTN